MIVLVILGIVLVVALPGFSNVFLGTRLSNYTNELVSSVYLARGEAIKRNVNVTLCASSDGTTCSTANTWGDGWIVLDPGNVVVSSNAAAAPGFVVAEAGGTHTLVFDGSGLVSPAAIFKICRHTPSVGGQDREVVVTNIGRTSVSTTSTGSCP
jgi:type IV fimbrial biogenesis protein FimT